MVGYLIWALRSSQTPRHLSRGGLDHVLPLTTSEGGFRSQYLEGGSPLRTILERFSGRTQNATEVLCRWAAQVIPGGLSAPEVGVRRLESSEVRVCQQCQQCQRCGKHSRFLHGESRGHPCQQCQRCEKHSRFPYGVSRGHSFQKCQRFWAVPVTVSRPTRQECAPGSTSDPPVPLRGLAGGMALLGSTPRTPR